MIENERRWKRISPEDPDTFRIIGCLGSLASLWMGDVDRRDCMTPVIPGRVRLSAQLVNEIDIEADLDTHHIAAGVGFHF